MNAETARLSLLAEEFSKDPDVLADLEYLRAHFDEAAASARPASVVLAAYLDDLGERAIRLDDEGILYEAADLVLLADDRSRFDRPDHSPKEDQ